MRTPDRFLAVGLRRAALEAGAVVFVFTLPLTLVFGDFYLEGRWPVLSLGQMYLGLAGGLVGALRLRRVGGSWRRELGIELARATALALASWVGAALAHAAGAWLAVMSGEVGSLEGIILAASGAGIAILSGGIAGVGYPLLRGVMLVWPAWDRLRRTRLLWALSHAQFVAALILAVGAATVVTTLALVFGEPRLSGPEFIPADGGPGPLLAWVATYMLPVATALLVLSVAASVAMVPPAALISYLVLRRTTRRLEGLAAAAEALRAGELATRVEVSGEDEVARLQASFNAMAADLQATLRDLQAERDRVAGLLEARRQLVASVSHELRTPVATVRGYLESALKRGDEVPSGLRAEMETMEREVARLQRLIEDLFSLSRAEVGKLELRLEPIDAGAVVRRLVDTVAPLAWGQRRVEVHADVAADLPAAAADAQRLEQVVSNLLGNAVRHTPPGGLVAAVVAGEPEAVRVEVRDTGEGIPPDDLPRVFERFYRGQNGDGPGRAGLGLALAKELVEAMAGTVEVASTPGEGSRFTVRLPRLSDAGLVLTYNQQREANHA